MQWKAAKAARDYETADRIRSQLRTAGIEAEDLVAEMGRRPTPDSARQPPVVTSRPPAARGAPTADAADAPSGRRGMAKKEAEALALQWQEARAGRDYATADGIRSRLRAVGIEAEDLAAEIEIFGLSSEAVDVSDEPTEVAVEGPPGRPDPLAYTDHMSAEAKALFKPTEAAARHKDGGTGGLLTLDYNKIVDLPPDIGYTVTAGKAHANEEALRTYKHMLAEEEEANRRQIAERNAHTLRARRA